MARRQKEGRTYHLALFGLRGVFHILLFILAAVFIVYVSRSAFRFGYAVFSEEAMAEEPGKDIIVEIPDGADAEEIGRILSRNGLVADVDVFRAQERLSTYHEKMRGGVYILNTSMTPTEIMAVLARENVEGQVLLTVLDNENTA